MSNSLNVQYGQPVDLMARIVDATDTPLLQSDVTTIRYTVYKVDSETGAETGVTSYTNVGIAIVGTIVNTLSTVGWDEDTIGWNFKHTIVASAIATLDQNYHVVYTFTVQGNNLTAEFFLLTYDADGTTLDASWGGDSADSYVTWAEANSFIKSHILNNAAWLSATIAQQKAALLQAALDLDARQYAGDKYYYYQKRCFPRAPSGNTTIQNRVYFSITLTQMWDDVKHAQCYQALWLLQQNGKSSHAEMLSFGITRAHREVGPIREDFYYDSNAKTKQVDLAPYAIRLLSKYLGERRALRG